MRLAGALLLGVSTANAFSSTFTPRTAFVAPQKSTMTMFKGVPSNKPSKSAAPTSSAGMDELLTLVQASRQSSVWQKRLQQSPQLFKYAGYASIPVGAALGFGLVPSRRLVAHAAGALVSGIAATVGRDRYQDWTLTAIEPAVAQALINGGLQANIDQVLSDFGVENEDDAMEVGCKIYSVYLQGMVKNAPLKSSEANELMQLRETFGLNALTVGKALSMAGQQLGLYWSKKYDTDELENKESEVYKQINKYLFLVDRVLVDETPGAYRYEMARACKVANVDYDAALVRIKDTAEPFYLKALNTARTNDSVTAQILATARETLGIEEYHEMHLGTYTAQVQECLGMGGDQDPATLKFAPGSDEKLARLQQVLELSDKDTSYEIETEATPLFQATCLQALKAVLAGKQTADQAWEIMEARREELLVSSESSKDLISSIVMQVLGEPLEKTNTFASVNNEAATYDHLLEALKAKDTLLDVMSKGGWVDNFDETFCNPWDPKSATGFLQTTERVRMFEIFVKRAVREHGDAVDDAVFDQIGQVRSLLGLTESQGESEVSAVFRPALEKVMNAAAVEMAEEYTPELADNMKERIQAVIEQYRLSDDTVRDVAFDFYSEAVETISAKSPAGIPTDQQALALEKLQEMFLLNKEDVYSFHATSFGKVYQKSVMEAMGSTGIIRPEVKDSLGNLQRRLGMDDESSHGLFLEAIKEKMIPMVQWVASEMERTMLTQKQLSERRGKDMGEDVFQTGQGADGVLGLGAEANIMGEIMSLVDFYKENGVASEGQIGTEVKQVPLPAEEGEEPKIVDEEVPIMGTVFPVTALGTRAIDQQIAELLYRQLVVSSFTTQGPNGARYEENREFFAGILGLKLAQQKAITSNIGSLVYDNIVSNAMKTKGIMDQQDMMTLASIQGKIGLESEESEELLVQSQSKYLSEEANILMRSNPSAEAVKAFREKCESMGLDIQNTVGVSHARVTLMFDNEVGSALQSGEIRPDNAEEIKEIAESLGLTEEESETILTEMISRLSKRRFGDISRELLRGRDGNVAEHITELIRYAAFVDGDLGLDVDEAMANQIVNIYDSMDHSDDDNAELNKNLLAVAVGLAEA